MPEATIASAWITGAIAGPDGASTRALVEVYEPSSSWSFPFPNGASSR